MFNLVKMDLYRLFHSLSARVILLITVCLAFFCVAMTQTDLQSMAEDPQYSRQMQEEISSNQERSIGIYTQTDPQWINGPIDAGELISSQLKSGILTLLVVIFTAIFVTAELKCGYLKNIAGQFPNREKLILSKLIVIALQVFLMMALFSAVILLSGMIFWNGRIVPGSLPWFCAFFGVQYLLHLGFASVILLLSGLTYSSAFSMTVGILACCGILVPIYSLINRVISQIRPGWNFDISRYMLDGNINMVGIGASSGLAFRSAMVGCAFTVICAILSMVIIKKRDIR